MSEERREMNLFEFIRLICRSIVNFFKAIGVFLLQTTRLAYHYWWIVLICGAVGFGLSFWLGQDHKVKYEGEATVFFSPYLRSQVKDGLNLYVMQLGSGYAPERIPPMTYEAASKFRKIESFNVIDCKNDSIPDYVDYGKSFKLMADTFNVVMPDRMVIRIKAKGMKEFSIFKESLQNFYANRPEYIIANEQRKVIEGKKLAMLEKEVARLDSFSTYDYLEKPAQLSLEMSRTMLISERKQEIYTPYLLGAMNKYNYIANQVAMTPEVINFQSDFVVIRTPEVWIWIFGTCAGIIIGLLIALALKYKQEIKTYMSEK